MNKIFLKCLLVYFLARSLLVCYGQSSKQFEDILKSNNEKDALIGRFLRGTKAHDFAMMSDDLDRKFMFYMESEGLNGLSGLSDREKLLKIGYTEDYIDSLLKKNTKFKLVLFPKETSSVVSATWDNVVKMVENKYPPEVGNKIRARLNELKELYKRHGAKEALKLIEEQGPGSFRKFYDSGKSGKNFINAERLSKSKGTLWDVRAFLFNEVYLTELYTGDGYTLTPDGKRGLKEFIGPNLEVKNIKGASILDLDVTSSDFSSRIFNTAEKYSVKSKRTIEDWEKFGKSRGQMSTNYHPEYTLERKKLHEQIIDSMLKKVKKSKNPEIVFVAGKVGSGKTSIINILDKKGILKNDDFLIINIDKIKEMLPEYKRFLLIDEKQAANMVHRESAYVAELLKRVAVKKNKNVIFETTLKDYDYYDKFFKEMRNQHPEYRINLVHVDINESEAKKRRILREKKIRRIVPESVADDSFDIIERDIRLLKKHADSLLVIDNNNAPTIKSLTAGGKKQAYRAIPISSLNVAKKTNNHLYNMRMLKNYKKEYHVAFDLDWTLFYKVDDEMTGRKGVVQVGKQNYKLSDHGLDVISKLDSKGVKISFYSGDLKKRNIELLKSTVLDDGTGRSLHDIAFKILSQEDLVKIDKKGNIKGKVFHELFKKDLKKITQNLNDIVFVDDVKNFSLQQKNMLWTGESFLYAKDYETAVSMRLNSKLDARYIPNSQMEYDLEKKKLLRVFGIIDEAIDESEKTGKEFASLVYSKSRSKSGVPYERTAISQQRFYNKGQKKLLGKKEILYLTDLEGRQGNLLNMIKENGLKMVNNKLEFLDNTSELVFGGDLTDRGPHSIKLRKWLVDFKMRYPERVTLIWGNRELKNLALLRDLPLMEQLEIPDYENWLVKRLGKEGINIPENVIEKKKILQMYNNKLNQMLWWTDSMWVPQILEFHRVEMEELLNRTVSLSEAAEDFIKAMNPKDGEFFKYLELGQIGEIKGNVLFVHGGITKENIGVIPGVAKIEENTEKWIRRLNEWGKEELNDIKRAVIKNKHGKIKSKLILYGDAIWDNVVKAVIGKQNSVIYPFRYKDSGNFRLPDEEVIKKLKANGIDVVVLGHSPTGNVPTPLIGDDFLLFHGDTSYAKNGEKVVISLSSNEIHVRGVTEDGTNIHYKISSKRDGKIGLMVDDYIVAGKTDNGKYLLFKYFEKHKMDEKIVGEDFFINKELRIAKLVVNDEVVKNMKILSKYLDDNKISRLSWKTISDDPALKGRKAVLFAGGSKMSFEDATGKHAEEVIERTLSALDPKKTIIVTGGTDQGVEKIVHKIAKKKGFKILGLIVETTTPSEISAKIDHVTVVSKTWKGMLRPGIEKLVAIKNGIVIFMGGGTVIDDGIRGAIEMDANYHLVDGLGGASGEFIEKIPTRGIESGDELVARIAEFNPEFLKEEVLDTISKTDIEKVMSKTKYQRMLDEFKRNNPTTKVLSYKGLVDEINKSKLKSVVLGGYSGLGYDNPEIIKSYIKEIMIKNGDNTIYILGATEGGIGDAYRWIPEISKELKFKNIKTGGIGSKSLLDFTMAKQNFLTLVDTEEKCRDVSLSGRSLMVGIAEETKGEMVYFEGGKVSKIEIAAAVEKKIPVTIYSNSSTIPRADNVAAKLKSTPNLIVNGTEYYTKNKEQFSSQIKFYDKSVPVAPVKKIDCFNDILKFILFNKMVRQ